MDAIHDQNFLSKIVKICVFCCIKYPIPISTFFLFLVSYLFFPRVFTILIYIFTLTGFSFLVHKVLLDVDRQKIKRVEEDDRRRKFAKSKRSFKSVYGDRSQQLIRRNTIKRSGDDVTTNGEEKDDFFSKTLKDLLFEGKDKEIAEVNVDSSFGRGNFSSLNDHFQPLRPAINVNTDGNHKDGLERKGFDISGEEDDPHDKAVRWAEDDQKNVMDLGVFESERNKRLEGLMERRKSRKNLGFQEEEMGNNNNYQVSAIKTTRVNPFLEDNSGSMKSPGSAPSSLLTIHNPFDIPYDPQEEKPDLSSDNFHEEFTAAGHQKEPIYCRHQSFSLGAFSHPEITTHDRHDIVFYKDLPTEQKSVIGLGVDNVGANKRLSHAPSSSGVSDLQVEVSDEGSAPTLDELEIEKAKESGLNSSTQFEADVEVVREADIQMEGPNVGHQEPANREIISSNVVSTNQSTIDEQRVTEPSGVSQSSVAQGAVPNGLTELGVVQAPITSSSPKSVLQRQF